MHLDGDASIFGEGGDTGEKITIMFPPVPLLYIQRSLQE